MPMMLQDLMDQLQQGTLQPPDPSQLPPGTPPNGLLANLAPLIKLGSVDQRHKLFQQQFDQAGQTAAGAPVDYSHGKGAPLALAGLVNLVSAGLGGYQQGKATGGLRDLVKEQDTTRTDAASSALNAPTPDFASLLSASPEDLPAKTQAAQQANDGRRRAGMMLSLSGDQVLGPLGKSLYGDAERGQETMLGIPGQRQELAGRDVKNQNAGVGLQEAIEKLRKEKAAQAALEDPATVAAYRASVGKMMPGIDLSAVPVQALQTFAPLAEKFFAAKAAADAKKEIATGNQTNKMDIEKLKLGAGGLLSPDALDQVAELFSTTGQLPSLGQGPAGAAVRRQIVNRAAELHPDGNLAGNKANYKADSGSLASQQKILDNAESWERTGKANLDVLLGVAQKLKDTGSPWLNGPVRTFMEKGAGDPNQTAFKAAHATVVNEYAKILSGAQGSGSVTEGARHEAESMLPLDATFDQMAAAAKILDTDAGNRIGSARQQVATIRGRTSGQPVSAEAPAAAPAAVRKFTRGKDGKLVEVK